jgi:hypothetical protein
MAFSTLMDSLKFASRVVLLALLTNIAIEMRREDVHNSIEMY